MTPPLVSILIPAYNAEPWIGDAIQSAIDQTWHRTEIVVVNDGSKDRTLDVARKYASNKVKILSHDNQGASATRNRALREAQGDYIQWLDADDTIDPTKIALQITSADLDPSILLSSAWSRYFYRSRRAVFRNNALCQNHTPAGWLQTKMETNAWMAIESWLVSRQLAEKAGPWDATLSADDDGEYFARVVCASSAVVYIHDAKSRCRLANPQSLSSGTRSVRWLTSQYRSIEKQIAYLQSLDGSERTRQACLTLLQRWYVHFYPAHHELVEQINDLARGMDGELVEPKLPRKYRWLPPIIGWQNTKTIQAKIPAARLSAQRNLDYLLFKLGL